MPIENEIALEIKRSFNIIEDTLTASLNKSINPSDRLKSEIHRLLGRITATILDPNDEFLKSSSIIETLLSEIINLISSNEKNDLFSDFTKSTIYREVENIQSILDDLINPSNHHSPINKKLKTNREKSLTEELSRIEERIAKRESELTKKIAILNTSIERLQEDVKISLDKAETLYLETEQDLNAKKTAIDEQLGTLTAATMAKDYAQFADIEKEIADQYRKYSLWAMFGVALMVAFSLWQSAKGDFTIYESIIRLSFILIISAPAVYLSKESAKHRNQENAHRQTNLDLRAITPYIASLSPTEQSQLKTQIALRIFGSKNMQQGSTNDGIPINANDLLMKILDKLEFSGKQDKSGKNE